MLPVLLLLMFAVAPFAQAQMTLWSVEDITRVQFVERELALIPDTFSRLTTLADPPAEAPLEVIGYPTGRGSGNEFAFDDFSVTDCPDGTLVVGDYNGFSFGGGAGANAADVSYQCTNAAQGRTFPPNSPTTNSLLLGVGGATTGVFMHTITRRVNMFATGDYAAIDVWIYAQQGASTTGVVIPGTKFSVQVSIDGDTPDEYSNPTGTTEPNSPFRYSRLASDGPTDGQWKRYTFQVQVGTDTNGGDIVPVDITLRIERDAAVYSRMQIDDLYFRFHRFIRQPTGQRLFLQEFDACVAVMDNPTHTAAQIETALNNAETPVANLWDLIPAVDGDQKCTDEQYFSDRYSLRLAQGADIEQGEANRLIRSITRIVETPIEAGYEVTLEFWIRYVPSITLSVQLRAPRLLAYYQINELNLPVNEWAETPFVGQSLPGPRSIQDDTTNPTQVDGWFRYRVVWTLPETSYPAAKVARFQIVIEQPSDNEEALPSGTFYIDNIQMRYTEYNPNGGVVGDPQFVGLYNQNYQVHGIDGGVYNLVSSPTTQVNSRFVFLTEGKCPIFDGIPARNCFAHAGSYLGAIGIQEVVDGVNHKLSIVSGPANTGFASIELDGMKLSVNDSVAHGTTFDVNFVTSHVVMVNTADFAFTFENSDMFVNQGVAAHRPLSQLTSHGLFGQTHKRVIYPSKLKYVEGEVDDYLVAEDDLFGRDFVYNQFHA